MLTALCGGFTSIIINSAEAAQQVINLLLNILINIWFKTVANGLEILIAAVLFCLSQIILPWTSTAYTSFKTLFAQIKHKSVKKRSMVKIIYIVYNIGK